MSCIRSVSCVVYHVCTDVKLLEVCLGGMHIYVYTISVAYCSNTNSVLLVFYYVSEGEVNKFSLYHDLMLSLLFVNMIY